MGLYTNVLLLDTWINVHVLFPRKAYTILSVGLLTSGLIVPREVGAFHLRYLIVPWEMWRKNFVGATDVCTCMAYPYRLKAKNIPPTCITRA